MSTAAWFEGTGFARELMLLVMGAEMGTGAITAHRLAMNIGAGAHLQPAPSEMARLVRYALRVHDPVIMKHAIGLQPSDTGLIGRDPTGTGISLYSRFLIPSGEMPLWQTAPRQTIIAPYKSSCIGLWFLVSSPK